MNFELEAISFFWSLVFCFYEKVEAELKSNKELSENKLEELQKEYKAR